MQIFQYKIIHRTLPTNDLLHKYNIRDNPWCDNCPNVVDKIEHSFHSCPLILKLWYDIAAWLSPEIDLYQFINIENILLGIYDRNKPLENTIILAIKRYCYICKCNEQRVHLNGAKLFLSNVRNIECKFRVNAVRQYNEHKWLIIGNKILNSN